MKKKLGYIETLNHTFIHEDIKQKYELIDLSQQEENEIFGSKNISNMKFHGFVITGIYKNQEGDYIFEIVEMGDMGNINGLVLSDAQKEVFGFDKDLNIIFIIGDLTDKRLLGLNIEKTTLKNELVLNHELEELKYWKNLDRLPFIPKPDAIKYFQHKGYNIDSVVNQDENILTREFIRGELIHLRADYQNLGETNNFDKGIIIVNFDKLDLEEQIRSKLKNAYIKAIKILKLFFLLNQKGYFEEEYDVLKQEKTGKQEKYNSKFKNILKIIPSQILQTLGFEKIAKIPEKDFLKILENPENKIQEIAIKNNTKYKIDKLKINTGEGWENWSFSNINIDGYFSYKIWVKTKITIKNLDTYGLEYIKKYINKVEKKLTEEIKILTTSFINLKNPQDFYINLGIKNYKEKTKNLDFGTLSELKYDGHGKSYETKINISSGLNDTIKEIGTQSYQIVLEEILKEQAEKKEKLKLKEQELGKIENSLFDDIDIFEDEIEKPFILKNIDFSDIIIEDYELFIIVEEMKKSLEDYYNFIDLNINIEEIDSLSSSQKQLIIRNIKTNEIIMDLTLDINNSKPIEFHFHSFCEGNEESIKNQILQRLENNGIITLENISFTLDEALQQKEILQANN